MTGKDPSNVKKIVQGIVTIFFLIALFFVPAGTLNWPEVWFFLILYFSLVGGVVLWLKKNNPGLLKERMSKKKDVKGWDKLLMLIYTLLLMVLVAVSGLDAVRFHWSHVPFALKALGFLGFIPSAALGLWALKENRYLSDVVRIQDDRGHTVCTTGPYRYVRHPMYAGVILFILCFPLYLGSLYAFIPASIIAILFVIRTSLEDATLRKELPGYKDYEERVRYKLVPRVW